MAKNDVMVKAENTAVALSIDYEGDASLGFDGMTQEDFALPYLKLLTGTSPELGEVDGAIPGMIFNSVSKDLYDGKKGIQVVPCAYLRQYVEWAPRGSGKGGGPVNIFPATSDILSRTSRQPGESKDYLENGNYIENTATFYVLVIHAEGYTTPVVISMKSTQLKKARKWNTMMMSTKMPGKGGFFTPPMYSQIYRLSSQAESNDKGKWYGWEIERIGPIESSGIYQDAKAFAQKVSVGDVNVKHDSEFVETDSTTPF